MKLFKHQSEFITPNARINIMSSGLGAGKTHAIKSLIYENRMKNILLVLPKNQGEGNFVGGYHIEISDKDINLKVVYQDEITDINDFAQHVNRAELVLVDEIFRAEFNDGEFSAHELIRILFSCSKLLYLAGTFKPIIWACITQALTEHTLDNHITNARTRYNDTLPNSYADVIDFEFSNRPLAIARGHMTSPIEYQVNSAFDNLLSQNSYLKGRH